LVRNRYSRNGKLLSAMNLVL